MKFLIIGLMAIGAGFSGTASATTVKSQLDAAWGNVVVGPATTVVSGRALLAAGPGTIHVQITTESTQMNSQVLFLCSVSFNRFLNRAINGPASDQWWLVTPYFTGQVNQLGGTASVTRTFEFTPTAVNTGVFPLVSCESRSGTAGGVRVEVKSTFYGND